MDTKKLRKLPKGADLSQIHPDLRLLAVPIGVLSGHPDNPRVHPDANKQAIAGSLRKYLQRKPVVANMTSEGLRIEAGHGVYGEMLAAGAQYIACTIVEDDPVTELGFMLADNRSGDLSEDDPEKLAPVLRQLIDAGEDVDEIGWDEEAVRALLGDDEDLSSASNTVRGGDSGPVVGNSGQGNGNAETGEKTGAPVIGKEYGEDIEKDVKYITCPACAHRWPQ